MRASRQEQVGEAGVNEVCSNFERMGWGPARNSLHDLGTDIFLQVRDSRLLDLGLIVGAQVKTGQSYFREPARNSDGAVCGWWYRDDDRAHIDYWLNHSVPHLLVLHDLSTRVSYWAHVTGDAVVSTGKGAKVLVAKHNLVDASNLEALLDVAGAKQPGVRWEGSIWRTGSAVPTSHRLRHALLVPRLIAPHPNAGLEERLSAEQAVAMLMQGRLFELRRSAEAQVDGPSLSEAQQNEDWKWRLVGALLSRSADGDLEQLASAVDDAPNTAGRTVATIATASGLIEATRTAEAIALIDAVVEREDVDPVDHAWLLIQMARARAEIGLLGAARKDALRAHGVRALAPNDATASAIAASAGVLLFNTSSWGVRDVEPGDRDIDVEPKDRGLDIEAEDLEADTPDLQAVVTGADTVAQWWRAQTTSSGLSAVVERSFKSWTRDASVTISAEDVAHNQLHAAALSSSHAGDQVGWSRLYALAKKNELLEFDRYSDHEAVANALDGLRLAGDDKAVTRAARRFVTDGPAAGVALAATAIDLEHSTGTTGRADLALLRLGGGLLDGSTAMRFVEWLLPALVEPAEFVSRTTPSYHLGSELVDTLASVLGAVDLTGSQKVISHVLALPGIKNQLTAASWARLIDGLPWTEEQAIEAASQADRHDIALRQALLGIAGRYSPETKAQLIDEASEGSLGALEALGDVSLLPTDLVVRVLERLSGVARKIVAAAHGGTHGMGGYDTGFILALLNVWHPEVAQWDGLIALLGDDAVEVSNKRHGLRFLADMVDRIPVEVQERLRPIAERIARGDGHIVSLGGRRDASGEAALLAAALGALDEQELAKRLLKLLGGDSGERVWAAALAGHSGTAGVGALVALASDRHPDVRAMAVSALASQVANGEPGPLAIETTRASLVDAGVRVPAAIAETLRGATTPVALEMLDQLRDHLSARVRRAAAGQGD